MEMDVLQKTRNLLLVEDDGYCSYFITKVLQLPRMNMTCVEKSSNALEAAADTTLDAIFINFQDRAEQELISVRTLSDYNSVTPIIAVCDQEEVDFALDVIHAGAFDYLVRPFNNAARVEKALKDAFACCDERRKTAETASKEGVKYGMIGKSRLLLDLQKMLKQIAPLQVNVLIYGESGTGKELIARAIHLESDRKSGPFVAVNCGAVPETLFESIFFGHEKGAFTGATRRHTGFLEEAQDGTLFLDEVGELSAKGQVALLRFLESQEFVRVGGASTQKADVHIIAATNRNLEQAVDQQRFRADLFFRLNVIQIRAPALRQRPEDILPLAEYFLTRFCLKNRLTPMQISSQAVNLLEQYDWPGNIRELENLMEGLAATLPPGQNVITQKEIFEYSSKIFAALAPKTRNSGPLPTDFGSKDREFGSVPKSFNPASIKTAKPSLVDKNHREAMEDFEARYFQAILEMHGGNVAQAARHAGIHPVTLHRKLRKFRRDVL
jgi:DNA-binding NtrC family response regulator